MEPNYESALGELAARQSECAVAHSRRVAETSVLLASIYNVDVEKARMAGLLHDWHRELGHEELVSAATEGGIEVTDADMHVPYLLHAQTGALDLAENFPELPGDVLLAVERHTVGDPRMSDLDKIVYVADMIEPGRDFPGVDDLREAAGSVTLADLFAQAYTRSIEHLVKSRKSIHPKTVEVWNALVARERR